MNRTPETTRDSVVRLETERANRAQRTQLSVLFVEDDEIDASLIEMALSKSTNFEIEVTRARTRAEATDFVQMAQFDLMLLDYWLGSENGLELLDTLGGRHGRLPVILLTGYSNQDIQRLGHNAGALSFLSKDDVSPNTLDAVIRSTLHTHRLESDLLASITRRDEALREQLDVLAGVSRNVDRPLQNISEASQAIGELVGDDGAMQQLAEQARVIEENVALLRHTVSELLERVRAEQQHIDLKAELIDLRELVDKSIRLIARQLAERRQSIAFSKPHLPVPVKVDQTAMLQALLNVISNAGKYSAKGNQIIVSLTVQHGDALVRVDDTGVGMSRVDIDMALQPFARRPNIAGGTRNRSGLGLSIVASIMEQHGGAIAIDSDPGNGTRVQLTVPLSR